MDPKVKRIASLSKTISLLRRKGKTVVFTNGCFDIIHAGHVSYLKKAKALGDILVVGLNSDSSVRKIKGGSRPINREKDRASVLSSFSFVDYIVIFNEDTPEKLIKIIRPDVLVKGGDWKVKDMVGNEYVVSYGGRIARIPLVKGFSTTSLIEKIARYG